MRFILAVELLTINTRYYQIIEGKRVQPTLENKQIQTKRAKKKK